ncbi:hypothetical protein [Opitutus terrae]|uniref:hypothetical protein n=1 Tax=Opitutus terrae TaxID=107709 RepID=UPI000323180D|nr:hypothetical protein [Opitutus terrae]
MTSLLAEPPSATPHRYQVYRQAKNGLHHNHGPSVVSPEDAVASFLQTTPAFEGGGVRLWDHTEMRVAASAEWQVETTRMGFAVRHRSNVFYDPALALVASHIAEREQLEQAITNRLRMAV